MCVYICLHTKKNIEKYVPNYQHCLSTGEKNGVTFICNSFFFYVWIGTLEWLSYFVVRIFIGPYKKIK